MPERALAKQQKRPERQPDRRPDTHEELIGVLNKFGNPIAGRVFIRWRTRERRQKLPARARVRRSVWAERRYAHQGDPGRSL